MSVPTAPWWPASPVRASSVAAAPAVYAAAADVPVTKSQPSGAGHRAEYAGGRSHEVRLEHPDERAAACSTSARPRAARGPRRPAAARPRAPGCRATQRRSARPWSSARCTVGTLWKSAVTRAGGDVDEDHAGAVGEPHGPRLVDPADAAALAQHDRAGDPPGVEAAGRAHPRVGAARAGRAHSLAEHQAARGHRPGRDHRALEPRAAGGHDPAQPRRRPVAPPTVVTHGLGCAAYSRSPVVAGRRGDDDVGLGRAQQRALHGVDLGGTAHGQADHVDPVAAGAVDRGDQVGGRAAVVGGVGGSPARLVDRDPGLRRHPGVAAHRSGHPPAPGRRRCRPRSRPSGCRGRRSRAARGSAVLRRLSSPKPSTNHRAATTLASQSSASQPSPVWQLPEKPRGSLPSGTAAANSGLSGASPVSITPTTVPAPPRRGPFRPIAAEARSVPASRTDLVRLDEGHVVGDLQLQCLGVGEPDGEPVERGRPAVRRARGRRRDPAAGPGAAAWRARPTAPEACRGSRPCRRRRG